MLFAQKIGKKPVFRALGEYPPASPPIGAPSAEKTRPPCAHAPINPPAAPPITRAMRHKKPATRPPHYRRTDAPAMHAPMLAHAPGAPMHAPTRPPCVNPAPARLLANPAPAHAPAPCTRPHRRTRTDMRPRRRTPMHAHRYPHAWRTDKKPARLSAHGYKKTRSIAGWIYGFIFQK